MLTRLASDMIAATWNGRVKESILKSLPMPPVNVEKAMNNILNLLLQERMQAWAICNNEGDVLGVATTQITEDTGTGEKALLIYSTYGFVDFPDQLWYDSYQEMAEFAKGYGCTRIYCYSNVEKVIQMAYANGAETTSHLLTFPIL